MKKAVRPRIQSSKSLARSWRLELLEDELRYPGKTPFKYVRVTVPESAVVLATRKDGKIPLVKQYRHGAGRFFWELPAGYLEKGETALKCIKREFKEEVGHDLLGTREIGTFHLQPSRSDQLVHIFTGKIGKPIYREPDITESIEPRFFSAEEIWKLFSKKPSAMTALAFLLVQVRKTKS